MQQRTLLILVGVLAAIVIAAGAIWYMQDKPEPAPASSEDGRLARAEKACQTGHDASKEGSVKTDVGASDNAVQAGATVGSRDRIVRGAGDNIAPDQRLAENAAIRACIENYLTKVEPASAAAPAP
jgi:hypothetical protein